MIYFPFTTQRWSKAYPLLHYTPWTILLCNLARCRSERWPKIVLQENQNYLFLIQENSRKALHLKISTRERLQDTLQYLWVRDVSYRLIHNFSMHNLWSIYRVKQSSHCNHHKCIHLNLRASVMPAQKSEPIINQSQAMKSWLKCPGKERKCISEAADVL